MSATVEVFLALVQKAHEGKLKLPAFQRKWQWKRSQVVLLFDSLRQGFPIGSFLFMKHDDAGIDLSPRSFEGANPNADTTPTEALVLDGQQRLTAGLELFFNEGPGRYYINLDRIFQMMKEQKIELAKDPSVNQFLADLEAEDRYVEWRRVVGDPTNMLLTRHLLATPLLTDDSELARALQKYKRQYPDREDFVEIVARSNLKPSQKNPIPITQIDENVTVEAVSRIFATLNSTGKLLTPFELVVAILFPHGIVLSEDVEIAKTLYPFYAKVDQYGDIFLQSLAIFAGKDTKKAALPKNIQPDIYRHHKEEAFKFLNAGAKLLTDNIGLGLDSSAELVVYPVIFPPMAYVIKFANWEGMSHQEKAQAERKIVRWFIGAILTRRYQQSTHDRQQRDKLEIPKWINSPDDSEMPQWLQDAYIPNLKSFQPDGAVGKLIRCLVNRNDLRDPLTDKKVGVRAGTHPTSKHHIFPTRFVPSLPGWTKNDSNNLALNVMMVEESTNASWLNLDPRQQVLQANQRSCPAGWCN